jgi:hypothetical protein
MKWTVMPLGVDLECGCCGATIPGDSPFALVTIRDLVRCQPCAVAAGFAFDAEEVDLERFRLEQERQRRPVPTMVQSPVRVPAPRPMVRASELAHLFDPRAAAAGRDD